MFSLEMYMYVYQFGKEYFCYLIKVEASILQVNGDEDKEIKKKVLAGETLEGVGKQELESLQRELREQETLISGYQQVRIVHGVDL